MHEVAFDTIVCHHRVECLSQRRTEYCLSSIIIFLTMISVSLAAAQTTLVFATSISEVLCKYPNRNKDFAARWCARCCCRVSHRPRFLMQLNELIRVVCVAFAISSRLCSKPDGVKSREEKQRDENAHRQAEGIEGDCSECSRFQLFRRHTKI